MSNLSFELDAQLTTPAFVQDPFPIYRALREQGRVLRSSALDGWLITGYDEARAALHDHAHLSNFGWELRFLNRLPPEVQTELPSLFAHFRTHGLIYSDPPHHTRLRRLVGAAFLPKVIASMQSRIEDIVDELLAQAPAQHFELVRDLAYPLPTIVIAEMFGAPKEDRHLFKSWSRELTSFFGTVDPDPERGRVANAALAEFHDYLTELIMDRRAHPRADVISALVQVQDGDDALALGELLNTCVILLVAGHETTTNLIGNVAFTLIRHPQELARLRAQPELMGRVIDETLRWDGPIQRVRRMVVEDRELGGVELTAGDVVYVVLGAANRDGAVFLDADRFWPERPKVAHIAFGLGVHFCLGAALARAEAAIAVAGVLAHFPKLAVPAEWEPARNPSLTIRGLTRLTLVG